MSFSNKKFKKNNEEKKYGVAMAQLPSSWLPLDAGKRFFWFVSSAGNWD
jgi:hypothetical protein